MRGVEFTIESDDGFIQVEWAPSAGWDTFPRAWDWWLDLEGEQVNSLDTYSGTASLGELTTGLYRLRIRAKDDGSVSRSWVEERDTTFRVLEGHRIVGETELRLSRILDRVGELVNQRDALQQLLHEALDDLEFANSAIQVLELQLQSLKALGSQPKGGPARRVWRTLASPAVATLVTITAVPVSVFAGLEAAQIQAQATIETGRLQADLDDHMAACLDNTERLIQALEGRRFQ